MDHEFIINSYTLERGAPAMLKLCCARCDSFILKYQKDGPGPLLRCYWDRIHGPEGMVGLEVLNQSPPQKLLCPKCGALIGEKGLYEKEGRLVFNLVEESFHIHPMD